MSAPDFLICLNCENPTYVFEWREGRLDEVLCEVCGADEPDEFVTEEDYEAMMDASGG